MDRLERVFVAQRNPFGVWEPLSHRPVLPNGDWHRAFTRPSCVLPADGGYALLYDGCSGDEYSPVYNIRTGLAYTADLRSAVDLTPDAPLLESPTPGRYATLRYCSYVKEIGRFFYEAARPDDAFELRSSPAHELNLTSSDDFGSK